MPAKATVREWNPKFLGGPQNWTIFDISLFDRILQGSSSYSCGAGGRISRVHLGTRDGHLVSRFFRYVPDNVPVPENVPYECYPTATLGSMICRASATSAFTAEG